MFQALALKVFHQPVKVDNLPGLFQGGYGQSVSVDFLQRYLGVALLPQPLPGIE